MGYVHRENARDNHDVAGDDINMDENSDSNIDPEGPGEDGRPMMEELWEDYDNTVTPDTPPAKGLAGGRVDALMLGRIIESYGKWLKEHGHPVGAWRIMLQTLCQLEREDTEALHHFVVDHWGDMRDTEITPAMANEWYEVALLEWDGILERFTD